MNQLTDLVLPRPLPHGWLEPLLLGVFLAHLAFVLLMLGTAVLGVHAYLRATSLGEPPGAAVRLLRGFLPFEALAVVLGVGPLLLVQVGYSLSFFTASNLLAPYWIALVALMIVAFLALDLLEHGAGAPSRRNVVLALVGLACLLAIPGVFVAVLLLAERPEIWVSALRGRERLFGALGWTWLVRYLHVLGAALAIAAAYHAAFTATDRGERRDLLAWLLGALLVQVALGIAMYGLVAARAAPVTLWVLALGVLAVLATIALVARELAGARVAQAALPVAAMAVLALMLLTRETLQQGPFRAVVAAGDAAAAAYRAELAPHAAGALAGFQRRLDHPVDSGAAIYDTSCAFCHGSDGDGAGPAAGDLAVRPEALRAVRATRAALLRALTDGVPGTGMGQFGFYDRPRLEALVADLDRRWSVTAAPRAVDAARVGDGVVRAAATWASTCAACHEGDGSGTGLGRSLRPPVPDLRRYGLTAERVFEVVSAGYPGTVMPSFASLPEPVRWGLADVVVGLRAR